MTFSYDFRCQNYFPPESQEMFPLFIMDRQRTWCHRLCTLDREEGIFSFLFEGFTNNKHYSCQTKRIVTSLALV